MLAENFYMNISRIDRKIFEIIQKLKYKDGKMVMKKLSHIPFVYDTSWQKRKN
jgi:hypothetical protein